MDTESLVSQLREGFGLLGPDLGRAVAVLEPLFSPAVTYRSPVQSFSSRSALMGALKELASPASGGCFTVGAAAVEGNTAYLEWVLDFRAKGLGKMRVEGVSRFRLEGGLIVAQRDYWDPLETAAEVLPMAGTIYRSLVKRFAA